MLAKCDVSIQQSAVSSQPSAYFIQKLFRVAWHRLWPWPFGHATRMATLCERRWDIAHRLEACDVAHRLIAECLQCDRIW
ncbi:MULTISPECIES: hypothetical protein [unclassified Moorena]|nr:MULTISPECIES: hypothetical protein [unclassified Moorena]NEP64737.1 hypothetical protein [Moorena sp. SIO3A5]NEQ08352.1 hypothetical protein [Moorena sp. SIO4E2]NEQ14560.1 hypothetical protein [Moorena sp. SIO3E2]NES40763.1 hypothetical protein [Moorena sp. SIO2C4]NET69261.1 hypothetical protein [Moorena sp. SIO1G6]